MTLESGTTFVGTSNHPVWLPFRSDWIPLEDLCHGDVLDTFHGSATVTTVRRPFRMSDVYNIEVHGHHVYRITDDGILVHNNSSSRGGFSDDLANAPIRTVENLPTVTFSSRTHPELAENIRHAQAAGHPSVLTHGGNAAANRATSLEGVPNIRPLSRDEYPFASSVEGGPGAWVGHVPAAQQNSQGGILSNFFRRNQIQPGDQYRVNTD